MTSLENHMENLDEEKHKGHTSSSSSSLWNQLSSFGVLNLERTRQLMILRLQNYRERIHMDTLRPLPLFLGINQSFCFAPDAFSPPIKHRHFQDLSRKSTYEKISKRFQLNFQFFLTNYFLIFMGIGVVVLCLNFQCLFYGGIVYALWVAHDASKASSSLQHHDTNRPNTIQFKIYNYEIHQDVNKYIPSIETRTKLLYGLTLWVVLYHCLRPFCTIVGLTSLMVIFHAIMRDPKQVESTSIVSSEDHYGKYKRGKHEKGDDDEEDYGNNSEDSGVIV